ncbi:unnamed protein product [Rotaria sordida]|uniref:Uncharacterized protein n=1 Tax=Rotaria sordida TaxID=392033 RepID=A0A814B8H1_9BILA|nr:unnamed protein product [Rotaria sordida]
MPYLRIFDINHEGSIQNNNLTYHDIIDRFNSSFWLEKECSYTSDMNLNSVKYLSICEQNITNNHVNYFPNVIQLTIKFYIETFDESFTTTINRLIPLSQLTRLIIEYNCDSSDNIQLIVNLLSQLEYFKIIVYRKEIKQLIRFLLSKSNTKTQHLFFLCISDVPVSYPKELKALIRLENLLHDYRIKYLNRDLYIWW